MKRISKVNTIKINDLSYTSTFLIGDSVEITPKSKALAVQREVSTFFDYEGRFEDYEIFTKKIPIPTINENLAIERINENPLIKLDNLNILGVSNASILQIGSTKHIEAESRVKHIRKLLKSEHPEL